MTTPVNPPVPKNDAPSTLSKISSSLQDVGAEFWSKTMTWLDKGTHEEWLWTVVGIGLSMVVYAVLRFRVQRHAEWSNDQKRQLITQARNILWVLTAAWVIMSWSKTLFPFLFSIVAILVAVVMATKEWILCWLGSLYRMTTSAYRLGDHISINGVRGEVIDIQWMQTRVFELGPAPRGTYYTGNVLSFPNSWLMTHQLNNETFFYGYGFHWIDFHLTVKDDLDVATEIVIAEANKVCEPFLEAAHRDLSRIQQHHFMEPPSVKPKIHIEFVEAGQLVLHLRFPAPRGRNNELAQAIMKGFLRRYSPSILDKWEQGTLKPQPE